MTGSIALVETFIVTVPRPIPYLGPLGPGETVNARGYVVRSGNGTIYPTVDRSVVVRITTTTGETGWGETYGLCAPKATREIINDLLAPIVVGTDADAVEATWDTLYGLMRVRGCTSGFHIDAIAALDIALWDLRARKQGRPLRDLLGPTVHATVPSYVSGLPAATLAARVTMAADLKASGHACIKFAGVVSHQGIAEEMAALRAALGEEADIMVDLHWKFTAAEALALIGRLAPYRPAFVEAPVKPEDVDGLAAVAARAGIPVAGGEEWYTSYEAANRLRVTPLGFIQPEMGHTGVTQFRRIAAVAASRGVRLAPHATVGAGLFLAASLQASATAPGLWRHEWQHSVFDRNLPLLETDMAHGIEGYRLPTGPGLGARPSERFWAHAEAVA